MKLKSLLMLLLIFFCLSAKIPSPFASTAIKWYSYDDGMALSKQEGKKIFLHFYADWCTWCKKMDKDTFSDMTVGNYINKNFIPIKVNTGKKKNVALRYNVRGLPATLFLTEKGETIGYKPGYVPPANLIILLKYIYTDSYKKISLKKFLKTL